jgi:hypothetical protein
MTLKLNASKFSKKGSFVKKIDSDISQLYLRALQLLLDTRVDVSSTVLSHPLVVHS